MDESSDPQNTPDADPEPTSPKEENKDLAKSIEKQITKNLARSNTFRPQPINNINVNIQTHAPHISTEGDQSAKGLLMPLAQLQFPNYNSAAPQAPPKQEEAPMSPTATTTNVIINQPMQASPQPPRPWRTGLCSICDDCHICCCSTFCFICYACSISVDMDESCCVPCCIPGPASLIALRTKIRTQENIQGSIMRDCCAAFWCPSCALCQLAREVKYVNLTKTE
ncbi:uncharacterized protein LOC106055311 [Biomphalaria glabrata]|uniref:Uncharacterized protein LOC106055311 n=1 Tax=Biomphalaria glabrata TaxID=6526 RepID=A0A9W2Z9Y0_BIOGL|nr:uncharacterized protein LOC106055311 [Biomphalaria glabrata]